MQAADSEVGARIEAQEISLDEIILDYLNDRQQSETLLLSVDKEGDLVGGTDVDLMVKTLSSRGEAPIENVEVEVRLICAASPPRSLASGLTGREGIAELSIRIPEIGEGAAALIVAASSALGRAELKYLLR